MEVDFEPQPGANLISTDLWLDALRGKDLILVVFRIH
jgi:hypothetical protein